jgi:hypothetical protein
MMITESIIVHVATLLENLIVFLKALYDRGCTKDRRRSKKALQREYEEMYIGTSFELDFRLGQVIVIVWFTF